MPIADVTSSITTFIGDHGLYAVFGLMVLAAVIPVASELTMLYAGALASGAFANAHVIAFGHQIDSHAWAYVAVSVTGLLGNLVGAPPRAPRLLPSPQRGSALPVRLLRRGCHTRAGRSLRAVPSSLRTGRR